MIVTVLFSIVFVIGIAAVLGLPILFLLFMGHIVDCFEDKKYKKAVGLIFAAVLLTTGGTYALLKTDYVRMRREVDEDWLYGKTIEEAQKKYYCPDDGMDWYKGDGYVQCVAHLREDDWLDGIKFFNRYYVKTDENGIITDVMEWRDN